jgi:uncharacterized membrane protein YjjP (DUF1212 family)
MMVLADSTPAPEGPAPGSPAPQAHTFVLKLGRWLHAYGYPAHNLEGALVRVSSRLGLRSQFFSTPTALFASFGDEVEQRTFQIRVEPGSVDLRKMALLEQVADEVAEGLGPAEGAARIEAIVAAPPPWGPALVTLAFALTSGAAARFFGGGLRELAVSFGIGLMIGGLACSRPCRPCWRDSWPPPWPTCCRSRCTWPRWPASSS